MICSILGVYTMTSLGKISSTSFQNDPTRESVLVNPYDPKELTVLNKSETVLDKSLSNLSTKLPPDQLLALQNDTALNATLKEKRITLAQYISNLENKLPSGLDLNTALKSGLGIKDLDIGLDRIKAGIKNRDESFAPSYVLSALKYMKSASKITNTDFYKKALDKANDYGLDFNDELTESSLTLGLIEGVLKNTKNSPLWQYIEGTTLGNKFGGFVVKEAIILAAKNGSYIGVQDIITNYTKEIDDNTRAKCLTLIFENFRIGDEDLSHGYGPASIRVVNAFNIIQPGWALINIKNNALIPHNNFIIGNPGLLSLLQYYANYESGIGVAALIQLDKSFKTETLEELVKRHQPIKIVTPPDQTEVEGEGFSSFGNNVLN